MRSRSPLPAPTARRRVVVGYVTVASLWIVLTDVAVLTVDALGDVAQSVKGAAFVVVTAAGLAALLRRRDRHLLEERSARQDEGSHLAMVVEFTQDVIYRIELRPRRFSFVSPSVEALLGVTAEEVMADPAVAERFVHPEDRELRAATASDEVIRLRWRHRDGRTLWTEQRNRLEEQDGVPVAVVGVARDITEQVLGTCVNDACSRLDRAVLDGGRAIEAIQQLVTALRSATEARRLRVTVADADGGPLDIEVADGVPVRAELALEAVSGPVRIELVPSVHTPPADLLTPLLALLAVRIESAAHHERRRRELERVEVALNATGIAILLMDPDGTITWCNDALVALTGFATSELYGATISRFVPGSQLDLHGEIVARLQAGGGFEAEETLVRSDADTFLGGVAVAPILDDDQDAVVGGVASILDLTEERRVSEELHAAQLTVLRRQRDLERERTMLVQTLSHELRTPLTVVLGAAQTLQRAALPGDARERLTRSLERGTDDLVRHLDAVLAATDGLAGEVVATTGRAIVGLALERLGSRHDLGRVRIRGDAPWTGPATEAASLLRPLLHNALKFSDEEPVEVEIAVTDGRSAVGADAPPPVGSMMIAVADHGPGIPPVLVPILATPFRQADSSVTRRHGGLGLGLHAARRSADRLGATLSTTTGSDGTRVVVVLPVGAPTPSDTPAAGTLSSNGPTQRGGRSASARSRT